MAKKVTGSVKLQIPVSKNTRAHVGTALGPQGVNIMEFCKAFNAKTSAKDQEGLIIPVVITIFSDRSFTFITKTPPVPSPDLARGGHCQGFGKTGNFKNRVGKITLRQGWKENRFQNQNAGPELLHRPGRDEFGQEHRAQSMGVDVVLVGVCLSTTAHAGEQVENGD